MDTQDVDIDHVGTDEQCADIFTKALPPLKWPPALLMLGITPNGDDPK